MADSENSNHKLITLSNLNTDSKVQNPLTGIYIYADGRLATKLRKQGILDPSTAPPEDLKRPRLHSRTHYDNKPLSKNAHFVVNKIGHDQELAPEQEINEQINRIQHNYYHVNFQKSSKKKV